MLFDDMVFYARLEKNRYLAPHYRERLDRVRLERADRLLFDDDRNRSLGAGLLFLAAAVKCGISAGYRYTDRGAPVSEAEGIHMSLSHSGDYAACVISRQPVGIDVQEVGNAGIAVAKRFFSKSEYEQIISKNAAEQNDYFHRIWTMKEAFAKMSGRPLAEVMGGVCCDAELCRAKADTTAGFAFLPLEGHILCVCRGGGAPKPQFIDMTGRI